MRAFVFNAKGEFGVSDRLVMSARKSAAALAGRRTFARCVFSAKVTSCNATRSLHE